MTMTPTSTTRQSSLSDQVDLVEIKPGTRFSLAVLKDFLPDVETVLFFGKVYELDAQQLGRVLHQVLATDLTTALFAEGAQHSHDLQDYLVGHYEFQGTCECYDDEDDCTCGVWVDGIIGPAEAGEIAFDPDVPHGEILPQVWEQLEVEVAKSIKDVAAKLESVVEKLPGKQGSMVFSAMMKMNARRPTLGDYRAGITHARQKENLLILDVSGSMSAHTVRQIVDDVVALSYEANAHMAIVSDHCTYWTPGTYDVDQVLAAAEYSGTHYEKLAPLFDRDWGTVITVADYDSSQSAKDHLARACVGRVDLVLDISLVNRPTFLAECVGQLADDVRPLLTASADTYGVLR